MPKSLRTKCKKCYKEIVFLKNKNGNIQPFDWDSFEIEEKQSMMMGIMVPVRKGLKEDGKLPLHMPHHATCPQAEIKK